MKRLVDSAILLYFILSSFSVGFDIAGCSVGRELVADYISVGTGDSLNLYSPTI